MLWLKIFLALSQCSVSCNNTRFYVFRSVNALHTHANANILELDAKYWPHSVGYNNSISTLGVGSEAHVWGTLNWIIHNSPLFAGTRVRDARIIERRGQGKSVNISVKSFFRAASHLIQENKYKMYCNTFFEQHLKYNGLS